MISLILIPTFFADSSNFLSFIECLKKFFFSNSLLSFLLSDESQNISGQAMTVDGNTERMN